jgi:hypothetical protein
MKHHVRAREYRRWWAAGGFSRFPEPRRVNDNIWVLEVGQRHSLLYDPATGKHLATLDGGIGGWADASARRFVGLCKRRRVMLGGAELGVAVVVRGSRVRAGAGFGPRAPRDAWLDAVVGGGALMQWLGEEFGLFGATDEGVRAWVYNGDLAVNGDLAAKLTSARGGR